MTPWIEQEFGAVDLGDIRLRRRLHQVAERMWECPQGSTASACGGWNETTGAYRLFKKESVTVDSVLAPHNSQVAERVKRERLVLDIQDTSELDFSDKKSLQGAGPLSEESRRGFFAHTEYVLQEDGLPLGLWHTRIYARAPEEHGQAALRKQLSIEEKESYRWLEGYRRACLLKELCPKVQVISMGDRENDIHEIFEEYQQRRSQGLPVANWIIRSNQDRRLVPPEPAQEEPFPKLHAQVEAAPLLGTTQVRIRAKKQYKKVHGKRHVSFRKARKAVLEIRACQVQLQPPFRPGKTLSPITLWVLMAKEIHPPADEEPIQWILLTDLSAKTLKQALRLIGFYCLRWQIEIFHKILKSGCRVEKAQLKTAERLLPRIALQMVVAWRIHYVTMLGRACPDLPASAAFEPWEWKPVVVVLRGKGAQENEPTLGEMIRYLGQLGGHLNRKGDGSPGPQAIWRGLKRMHDFAMLWRAWK